MRHTKVLAIAFAASLLMAGCTKAETPESAVAKPVAVVNGTPISNDVWELYVKASHQNKTAAELTEEERKKALDDLIAMYVGAQEAEKQKLATGEPAARLELVRMSGLAEMLYKKVVEEAVPTDAELKTEYEARIKELPLTEFRAKHILVEDEAKAKDLIVQLGKGANFEKLASEHSSDEGTKVKGGELPWFTPEQMVPEFSNAVKQLEVGKYTATPVQSQFGWHVIRLEEKRPTSPPPFEAVKEQIKPMVNQKKFEKHLEDLVAKAKVERTAPPAAAPAPTPAPTPAPAPAPAPTP